MSFLCDTRRHVEFPGSTFVISSAAMKRFLLLFLLAVLPLQIPWAAGVAHCPHDGDNDAYASVSGDTSHTAHGLATGDGDEGLAAGAGPDCSVINLVALEPPAVRAQASPRAGATAHDVAFSGHKSHIPDGLDRPNWDLAA
jgi:hypothetical protein